MIIYRQDAHRGIHSPSRNFRRGETRIQPVSDSSHINLTKNLFGEFPPVPTEEWEAAIRKALNGRDYRKELLWNSREGFTLLPFYRASEKNGRYRDPETEPWLQNSAGRPGCTLVEQIDGPTPEVAAAQIATATQHNAEFLQVHSRLYPKKTSEPGGSDSHYLSGSDIQTLDEFDMLSSGSGPKCTGFLFDCGVYAPALAAMQSTSGGTEKPDGLLASNTFFTYDPYTFTAENGCLPMREERLEQVILQLASLPQKTLAGDGLFYHRCGATLSDELGIALAIGSEYLAAGRNAGTDLNCLSRAFWMRLSVGTLFFPEIARFRAARILWRQLLEAYDIEPEDAEPIHIHAVTSPWYLTAVDPYNNLVRTTTEAMSAIIGGADSLTVMPFDSACTTPSDRSRRLARNVHHIVREESFLEYVADPAAGCWYIEELTDQIAESSWNSFRKIESEGGMLQSLRSGTIQQRVRKSAEQKIREVLKGTRKVTGINYFPDRETDYSELSDTELPVTLLRRSGQRFETDPDHLIQSLKSAYQQGASTGDISNILIDPPKERFPTLVPSRLTQKLEERWKRNEHPFSPESENREGDDR